MRRRLINRETGEELYRGKWFGGEQDIEMLKPTEPEPSELEAPVEPDEEEEEENTGGEGESILSPWGTIENESEFCFTYKSN